MNRRKRAAAELFGPHATALDAALALTAGAIGALLAVTLTFHGAPQADLAAVVVALVAFDLFGGLWSNAQFPAWRGVSRDWVWKVRFTALHPHPFAVALAVERYDLMEAALLWGTAVAGAAITVALPTHRRLAGALFVCAVGAGSLAIVNGAAAPAWLAPVYLLKLVAAFAGRPDSPR